MAKTVVENKEQILIGEGRDFERIRRITGYLVGHHRPLEQRQARRGARPSEAHSV